MLALLGELTDEFGEPRLFRPYRDVRFSRDKTPYKTSIAGDDRYGIRRTVGTRTRGGSWLPPDECGQLDRYRAAVAADRSGAQLERVVRELRAVDIEVRSFDELKTAPRRYPKEHPRIELLRYKGVVAMRSWPPGPWLASARPNGGLRIPSHSRTAGGLADNPRGCRRGS